MERKYCRQYENFEKIVPESNEFPIIKSPDAEIIQSESKTTSKSIFPSNLKIDDIVIIGILLMLLSEEEKDMTTIILLGLLLLSEQMF